MADHDTTDRIRAALEDAGRIAGERVSVELDGGEVVLRGSVASAEAASAAALVAEQHADGRVRNELRVDEHLREGPHRGGESVGGDASEPDAAGGMVDDGARALADNEPWDPPDQPHLAPSAAEQRGETDRAVSEPPAADAGPVDEPDDETPSAADLSAEELARSATGRTAPGDPSAGREE